MHALIVLPVAVLLWLFIVACSLGTVNALPNQAATLPNDPTAGSTFAPIVTVTRAASPTIAPMTPPAHPCGIDPAMRAAQYDIAATIDVDNRMVSAVMHATYRNDTGRPLQQVVFNVDPNRKQGVFTLVGIEAAGTPVTLDPAMLASSRFDIPLSVPLTPSCQTTITLRFTLRVNTIDEGFLGRGYFGYSERQINLGGWLPEIAPYAPNAPGNWLTPKTWSLGEYGVSMLADYKVRVKLTSADPQKLTKMDVIGPGEVEKLEADTWHFKLDSARSFTLCVSPAFERISAVSDNGVTVDLYYFPGSPTVNTPDGKPTNSQEHALDTAHYAVNQFSKLYGPPPHKRIVIVQADYADGTEFSGMVFIGRQWFMSFDGKPDAWVTLMISHEIAHQWWYSLVGNDQGEAPFLDEALALYHELLYVEDRYPALAPWWWTFRVKVHQPQGYVDSKIYDFQNLRLYINAVYLRGALMLQEIRDIIGSEAFFKWLNAYRVAGSGVIATPLDFWRAMSPEDYAKIAAIRTKYLRQPDPLNPLPPAATGAVTLSIRPAQPTLPPTSGPATAPCCG